MITEVVNLNIIWNQFGLIRRSLFDGSSPLEYIVARGSQAPLQNVMLPVVIDSNNLHGFMPMLGYYANLA